MPHSRDTNLAMTAQQTAGVGAPAATHGSAGHEEHLVSALQAALHSLSGPGEHDMPLSTSTTTSPHTRSGDGPGTAPTPKERPHTGLDIVVGSDVLHLRGTGVDVEPTLLTGNVVLTLTEPTSIKQIVLVFRGKARVPANPNDPHVLNNSPNQYIVCNHEWTFLEGEKKHSHTLKAGRHLFPFELRLGGSLPSSLATYVNGGASISYKLRATAVRPGLATNLTAVHPVTLLRAFAPESLEYQQTLEIENTWPEKVMYALMIPHKAWAAGDELTALVKFAPLAKGVRVLTITTHLCETTRTLARGGHLEKTRNVVTRKHEIVNGRAVSVEDQQRKRLHNALQSSLGEQHGQQQPPNATPAPGTQNSGSSSPGYPVSGTSAFVSGTSTPVIEGLGLALSRAHSHDSSSSGGPAPRSEVIHEEQDSEGDSEVSTSINFALPASLTPSHSLDPIIVSYRVRWSVLLGNLDGHTSELRCSLPIHILDYSLLDEARAATLQTRRLLFGIEGTASSTAEDDTQLPSYPSHVRDRIAIDVSLPEARALRPYAHDGHDSGTTTPASEITLGLGDHPGPALPSSLPTHDAGASPFAYGVPRVDTSGRSSLPASTGATPPESASPESSRPSSRPGSQHDRDREGSGGWGFSLSRRSSRSRLNSRVNSRANSRAPSPERGVSGAPSPSISRPDETHIHAANAASRQPHGLFSVMMKPMTSLSSFSAPWHAHAHSQSLAHHFQNMQAHRNAALSSGLGSLGSASDIRAMTMPMPSPLSPYDIVTISNGTLSTSASSSAVPDYFTASHSGSRVPPLDTLRGLPTYEDSEAQVHGEVSPMSGGAASSDNGAHRSFSDTDLVSHFARARSNGSSAQLHRVR